MVIENNVIAFGTNGGIDISGPAATTGPSAGAVPFARIVNNTIYGGANRSAGVGINVGVNASPTILNNVVANFNVGIQVDRHVQHDGGGHHGLRGQHHQPHRRQPDVRHRHRTERAVVRQRRGGQLLSGRGLAHHRQLARLRCPIAPNMVKVRDPLGIPPSPILAPDVRRPRPVADGRPERVASVRHGNHHLQGSRGDRPRRLRRPDRHAGRSDGQRQPPASIAIRRPTT